MCFKCVWIKSSGFKCVRECAAVVNDDIRGKDSASLIMNEKWSRNISYYKGVFNFKILKSKDGTLVMM